MPVHFERSKVEIRTWNIYLIENSSDSDDTVNDTDFVDIPAMSFTSSTAEPQFFDQSELNDIVCDLDLSNERAQVLAFKLSKKNVLKPATNVSLYGHRDKELWRYCQEDGVICQMHRHQMTLVRIRYSIL